MSLLKRLCAGPPNRAGSPCTPKEFEKNRQNRTRENTLSEGDYYTLLYQTETKRAKMIGAKMCAQVLEKEPTDFGFHVVRFCVVKDDFDHFDPPHMIEGNFKNGYWHNARNFFAGQLRLSEAYLMQYDNGNADWIDELLTDDHERSQLPKAPELVGV